MLQSIHDRVQGWFAKVIFLIIAVVFVLWGVEYYFDRMGSRDQVLATVGDAKISQRVLDASVQRWRQQVGNITDDAIDTLKLHMLRDLITHTALVQQAQQLGFAVPKQTVNELIWSMPEFQVNGQFSPQRLQQLLAANAYSLNEFLENLSKDMLLDQIRMSLTGSQFALPSEIQRQYQLAAETRDIGYVVIPNQTFLTQMQPSPTAIQNYYQQHQTDFRVPPQVKIQYIRLSPENFTKEVSITANQLQQYYQEHANQFLAPVQWHIEEIAVSFKSAANQTVAQQSLAKEHLQQVADAVSQGKSFESFVTEPARWVALEQLSPALATVIQTLKPGTLSRVVQTADGLHLVKLLELKKAEPKPYVQVEDDVRKALLQQQTQGLIAKKSDELANLTYTNPSGLDQAAKALGLSVQTSDWFARQGGTDVTAQSEVVAAAFGDDVLKKGNNSNLILLNDGSAMVLRVAEYRDSTVLALSAVQEQIANLLKLQMATDAAHQLAENFRQSVVAGQTPEAVAAQHQLTWVKAANVSRDEKIAKEKIPAAIVKEAFFMQQPKNLQPMYGLIYLNQGDSAVVGLFATHAPDFSTATADEKSSIQKHLMAEWGDLFYMAYVHSTLQSEKISIEDSHYQSVLDEQNSAKSTE